MTQDELRDEIWKSMPGLRKYLLGRKRVDRIVNLAASRAPVAVLRLLATHPNESNVVESAWRADVKKHYSMCHGDDVITFGPLFWIVASAVIQYAIQRLMEWWFERHECRELIRTWSTT